MIINLQDVVKSEFDLELSDVEMLHPDLQYQTAFGGRAHIYVARNAARPTVDAWFAKVIENHAQQNPSKVLVSLYDFSAPGCNMTPYARQKNLELARTTGDKPSWVVIVLQKGLMTQVVRLFLNSLGGAYKASAIKIVFSREEALQYMYAHIGKIPTKSNV
jgi:hypothetical protein